MQTTNSPSWQNQPFRLDTDEIADPYQVLIRFCNDRDLPEHREILWEIQSAAIGGNTAEHFTGKETGEWIYYMRQLEELIEAASLIAKQPEVLNKKIE